MTDTYAQLEKWYEGRILINAKISELCKTYKPIFEDSSLSLDERLKASDEFDIQYDKLCAERTTHNARIPLG